MRSNNIKWRVIILLLLICIFLLKVVKFPAVNVGQFETLVPFNEALFRIINSFNFPALDFFFLNILNGFFGIDLNMGPGWIGIFVLLHVILRYRKYIPMLLLAAAFQTTITTIMKKSFLQLRPPGVLDTDSFHALLPGTQNYSFPSADTAFAFAIAAVMWYLLSGNKKWLAVYIAYPIIIAWQRMYIGVHFPLDVLVGALAGLLAAAMAIVIFVTLDNYDKNNKIILENADAHPENELPADENINNNEKEEENEI